MEEIILVDLLINDSYGALLRNICALGCLSNLEFLRAKVELDDLLQSLVWEHKVSI